MRHPYGSVLARIGHPPIPAGPAHPPALAWLGHPVTVVATIVLLINDHVLKALWPGLVTGKLSDVAGLLVAPPLLALVRVPALGATIATGTGFVLVKTTATGAALASQAWTLFAGPSRVLADPTDLVALPALGLAWLVSRRCRADHAGRPRGGGGQRQRRHRRTGRPGGLAATRLLGRGFLRGHGDPAPLAGHRSDDGVPRRPLRRPARSHGRPVRGTP
ncbi:hypothetical protein [Streptosporangium canum]|uniref:hypothetical protein n=1 Tax=Streptosporangium canum TaxID=324952 RepID=UPI000A9B7F1E|nr:hypothetical protein [Streptosporangium canum]